MAFCKLCLPVRKLIEGLCSDSDCDVKGGRGAGDLEFRGFRV